MDALKSAIALSVVVERLIEYIFAPLWDHFKIEKKWLLYVQLAAGLGLAVVANVDFMGELGVVLAYPIGTLISGLIVGGGSEFLHQILALLETTKQNGQS